MPNRSSLSSTVGTIVGVLVGLAGGYYWYKDYVQRASLEASAALHQARLQVCLDVSDASAALFSATTPPEYGKSFDRFAELKHGKALAILDASVIRAMLDANNAGADLASLPVGPGFQEKARCALGDRIFKIAYACRAMIRSDFRREGGDAITDLDETLKVTWESWSQKACH
jgi:hypothetical protein